MENATNVDPSSLQQDVETVVEQAITSADEDMLDPDWREIVNSLTNASQVGRGWPTRQSPCAVLNL